MLSIDYIRENPDRIKEAAEHKNREVDVDLILQLDEARRGLIVKADAIRQARNELAKQPFTTETKEQGIQLKGELKSLEDTLRDTEARLEIEMLRVPNVPLQEVPIGHDESDNVVIKTVGTIPQFSFKPKSHIELIQLHDLADLERGTKVSGFRGYFLKGKLAAVQMGLMMYAMRTLMKKGYTPLIAPSLVKGFTLYGNGQFPWGEEEVYKTQDDDAYLAGTAEVPVTSYFSGETLNESDLPKKFVGFSPCFRREIGSYGKDTKGLYRVHEFWKIEQVIITRADMDHAKEMHEELQQNCEELLEGLELPYRVLLMCTGDMGEPQVKKYDTEVWMSERGGYGETMSNSIMGDFQARRLKMRYKTATGETKYCYTLNNTAIAAPRILIPLLENHQHEDGSITIPKALVPYVGFDSISK